MKVTIKSAKLLIIAFTALWVSACNSADSDLLKPADIKLLLQKHYAGSENFTKFTATHYRTSEFGPQSYQFDHPEEMKRRIIIDIDYDNDYYFARVVRGPFPGGFVFDTSDFQNEDQNLLYDNNGVLYGKQVIPRSAGAIEGEKDELNDIIDFLAVKPLLQHDENLARLTFIQTNTSLTIKQEAMGELVNTYIFNLSPFYLKSKRKEKEDVTLTYDNYTRQNKLTYARNVTYQDGNDVFNYLIENLEEISAISKSKLEIPMGYGPILSGKEPELMSEEIADNLYLISQVAFDRYVLVKDTGMGLAVFGAPGSDKVSEKVIQHIEQLLPMKKIKSVYVTHHHSDHIGGIRAYAKQGAEIIADSHTIEAIKHYPKFSEDLASFKFNTINNGDLINDVRFYLPENSHALGQSFAYFEKEEIIYEGDLLEIPFDNTIATHMSEVEKQFVEFIREKKLPVKRIVGHHRNGNITLDVMNAYYQANTSR